MGNAMFYELAKRHAAKVNPFGALCQCNWETRGGGKPWTSSLFIQGNNGAGIKAGKNWTGKVVNKSTWEQRPDGSKYDTVAAFRAYDSVDDFLEDYADKINICYPLCATDNLFGYFAGLYKGKYGSWEQITLTSKSCAAWPSSWRRRSSAAARCGRTSYWTRSSTRCSNII